MATATTATTTALIGSFYENVFPLVSEHESSNPYV